MDVPHDIADRLRALGHAPDEYLEVLHLHGADFLHFFVERLEDGARLYDEWSPRLRKFAAACRVRNPFPKPGTLDECDAAKLSIYGSLIIREKRPPIRENKEVLLCSIPLVGMAAAMSLWPGEDDRSVFLTPEELLEWQSIYEHPEESFWWFRKYWWSVEDPPVEDQCWPLGREMEVPRGKVRWLVISGMSVGSLSGGETAELWVWNGKQAEFVRTLGCLDF